eukprot:SAG22_NODE_17853_length_297_cov_1.232323_1_plen_35_part_10
MCLTTQEDAPQGTAPLQHHQLAIGGGFLGPLGCWN